MLFKVLAVGDVTGESGVDFLRRKLRPLKKEKDIDFVAVNGENAAGNGLLPAHAEDILAAGADVITLGQSDILKQVEGKADLVIANIIADIIIRLFDELEAHLNPGGSLLASGIIADRIGDVTEAALAHGFTIDKVVETGGWAAMVIHTGGKK